MKRYRVLFECGGPIVYVHARTMSGAERAGRRRFRQLCNIGPRHRVRWGRAWIADVTIDRGDC